ncbi:MAG: cell envelope integrity protein TolA [Succinivibrio sp.]|jgi:colicin import membrane protein|nr:cell envelope integrity protein TolA [Succinivibrio sp.]
MKISLKTAFVMALALHVTIAGVLLLKVSLDRPEKPNMGAGNIMHATFIPPAKGNPNGSQSQPKKQDSQVDKKLLEQQKKQEELRKELEKRAAEQKAQEKKRQEAIEKKKAEEAKKIEQQKELALKKKKLEEEKKKKLEEEKKKKAEEEKKKKLEEEKKKKAEAEKKKKLEEEKKKKAEEEKKKLEEEKKKKLEEEKKKKEAEAKKRQEEAEAKARAAAEAKAKAQADSLEDDILGTANGDPVNGQGLGSGAGGEAGYGDKVRGLIEQNWRVDQSMNGKRVVVSLKLDSGGIVTGVSCQGDDKVCQSAVAAIELVGMFPRPPADCPQCSNIKISMTPKL